MPGACPKLVPGHQCENPKMGVPLEDGKRATCFLRLLPTALIKNTATPETSKHLCRPLSFGELTKFLGLWIVAACFPGASHSEFFSTSKVASTWDSDSPAKSHHAMNSCRFEELTQSTQLTKNESPLHEGKLHEVRELIVTFNDCMKKVHLFLDLVLE